MTPERDDPMTDSSEHLSCLMDGELERDRQRFLLKQMAHDPSLTLTWRRFHLVRACLHQELSHPGCIAERVSLAISQETLPAASRFPGWLRPVAGGAIAASAALFAIIAINSSVLQRTSVEMDSQPGFVAQPSSLDQPFARQPIPVSFEEMSPAQRQRVNTYVLRHNQAAGGSGFVSYIPIVSGAQGEQVEIEATPSDLLEGSESAQRQGNQAAER
jgi:sigma-E factor negative regulatory protein RseA